MTAKPSNTAPTVLHVYNAVVHDAIYYASIFTWFIKPSAKVYIGKSLNWALKLVQWQNKLTSRINLRGRGASVLKGMSATQDITI